MTKTIDLNKVKLEDGAHDSYEDGMCVMELAAYLAGEKHSDRPECVSPVLGAFLRDWNDSVNDDFRQRLKPYAERVLNTAGDGKDEARTWMATDWLIRTCTPAWLDLAQLTEHAMALRTAEKISSAESASKVQGLLNSAQKGAAATRAASETASWAAVSTIAKAAVRTAGLNAALSASWNASWVAVETAAFFATRDASETAAETAAGNAVSAAVGTAVGTATETATETEATWVAVETAAGNEARNVLQPTVLILQESAMELLDRMI